MVRIGWRAVVGLAAFLILGCGVSHSQTAPAPLNMVPGQPDHLGQSPNHLIWIRDGLQAIRDPLDGDLVFVNDDGRVVGRVALPVQFWVGEVIADTDQVKLIDVADLHQVTFSRMIDPTATPALTVSSISDAAQQPQVTRKDEQHLLLNDRGRRAGAGPLTIGSVSGSTLAYAYEIGPASGGNRYFVTEEIVAVTPRIHVQAFVQRIDQAGNMTGVAHVPLDEMEVPPRDYATMTGNGAVRVLIPNAGGVKIRELQFSAPASPAAIAGNSRDRDVTKLGTISREISVDSNIQTISGTKGFLQDEADRTRFTIKVPTPPISRDRVLANARAYLTVNWVMAPENYSKPSVENVCRPEEAKFWRRPVHFTREWVGRTIGPMPYRWGGDDTPSSFKAQLEWGALAGDICTCRSAALDYCLMPGSAGVDCSGYVSRAWGIEKRGTTGLLDVATPLRSFSELQPGDAMVLPGSHVRLFAGWQPGAGLIADVLESTTRLQCEGVCARSLRPSEFNGYELIRYRGITS